MVIFHSYVSLPEGIWSFHSYHQMDIKWILTVITGIWSLVAWMELYHLSIDQNPNCVLFLDIHRYPQLCCFYQFYHEVFKWQCPSSSLLVDIPIFFAAHTVSQFCFVFDRWIPNLPSLPSPEIHIKRLRISRPYQKPRWVKLADWNSHEIPNWGFWTIQPSISGRAAEAGPCTLPEA